MSYIVDVGFEYDYLAIGHITRDVIESRSGETRVQPGGSAFYAALQAARLGLRALIVTRGVPAEIEQLIEPYRSELEVEIQVSAQTTTLATVGGGAKRVQHLRAWAGPIERLQRGLTARIMHYAPVAQETSSSLGASAGSFMGITPQGLARKWGSDGRISSAKLDPRSLPDRFDAAVISERELDSCKPLFDAALHMASRPPIVVTAGSDPVHLHLPDGTTEAIDPVAVSVVRDDLGAGDVFAATFFVALCDARPMAEAVRMGSASAALRIAGGSPGAVADASSITALLTG